MTMVTAYNYPQALHLDLAGIDICLVGDSVAMVELGHDTTQAVSVDEMIHHCKAVARGAKHPLIGIGLGDTKALLDADIRIQTRGGTFHRDDVHSSYISALVEMGAVGFLLYVAASGWLLVTCVRRARRGAVFGAALVSASVAWCVFNVFSTGYTSGQVFALYGVIAAFALMPITRNDLAE